MLIFQPVMLFLRGVHLFDQLPLLYDDVRSWFAWHKFTSAARINWCRGFGLKMGVSNKRVTKTHGKPIERLQRCSGVPKIQSIPRIILSTSKDFNHATSTWCTWWSLIFSINLSGSSFITAVTLSILECLPFIVRRNPRFPHWFVVVRGTPKASLKRAQKRR